MNIKEFKSKSIKDLDIISPAPVVEDTADKTEVLTKIAQAPHVVIVSPSGKKAVDGIITPSDIAKISANANARTLMSGNLVVAKLDQTIDEVVNAMKDSGKSVLPVLNATNEFVGVITSSKIKQKLSSDVQLEF